VQEITERQPDPVRRGFDVARGDEDRTTTEKEVNSCCG